MAFLYSTFWRKMLTSWSLRGKAPPLYKRDCWWGSLEPWCICCSRQAGQVWWLQPSILATLKTEARESSQVQSQPELQSESPSHYRVRFWQKHKSQQGWGDGPFGSFCHEYMRLWVQIPWHPCKIGVRWHCSAVEQGWGDGDRQTPAAHWPAILEESVTSGSLSDLVWKNKAKSNRGRSLTSASSLYIYIYTNSHAPTVRTQEPIIWACGKWIQDNREFKDILSSRPTWTIWNCLETKIIIEIKG